MIEAWGAHEIEAEAGMEDALLVELREEVRRHPWWQARSRLVTSLLAREGARRVLDAGCGWGTTFEALEATGFTVTGLDASLGALRALDRDRPGRHLVHADLRWQIRPPDCMYDAVLALDVLEHLDDDRGAVANLAGLVRPGGQLVVSVPALPSLYGEFDEIQGHRRRYDESALRFALDVPGLTIERVFWWGSWMVPVVAWQRRRRLAEPGEPALTTYGRYLRVPRWPLSWGLDLAFRAEAPLSRRGWLPVGTSLWGVARRVEVGGAAMRPAGTKKSIAAHPVG